MDRATRPESALTDIKPGWAVYSADEQHVGDVQGASSDHVVVRSGLFGGRDRTIPRSAIRRIEHDRVYLGITKDEVAGEAWAAGSTAAGNMARSAADGPPSIPESIGTPGLTGVAEEGGRLVRAGTRQEAGALETREQLGPLAAAQGAAAAGDAATVTGPSAPDTQTLRLHEERLQVGTERVQPGEVQVDKQGVTELQTMQAPVQREEVVIEREGQVTVVSPGGYAVPTTAGGVAGLWQRLRARPALLVALLLGTLVPLALLGLWKSGRIGATSAKPSLRTPSRTIVAGEVYGWG